MKRIDVANVPPVTGTLYPPPFDARCLGRARWRLGDEAGLTQFGVNLQRLPPGQWSSQRHWHSAEDEFVWVLEGEVVLVTDAGEEVLRAGEGAGFKAGEADGHHLQNRSDRDALFFEVGSRRRDVDATTYSDIDMKIEPGGGYLRQDGTPYPMTGRRSA